MKVFFKNSSVVSGSTDAGQGGNGIVCHECQYCVVGDITAVETVKVRPVRKASSIRRGFLTRRDNLSALPESRALTPDLAGFYKCRGN